MRSGIELRLGSTTPNGAARRGRWVLRMMRLTLNSLRPGLATLASAVLALGCGACASAVATNSGGQRRAYKAAAQHTMATLARLVPPSGFHSVTCFNHIRHAPSGCWRRSSSLPLSESVASDLMATMGLTPTGLPAYGGVRAVCTGPSQRLGYRVGREKCWADASSGAERLLVFVRSLVVASPRGVRSSSLGSTQAALGERGERRVPGGTEVMVVVLEQRQPAPSA
jgi:hypothetical protein